MAEVNSEFPYAQLPQHQIWSDASVSRTGWCPSALIPIISQKTALASAGSCFARRISTYLQQMGFNYLNLEPGPPWFSTQEKLNQNYGVYSARYGNIYTSLQLLQLLERALGEFTPLEDYWPGFDGFVDPFRPTVQRDGFTQIEELRLDRQSHFQAVRRVFETASVFIVTLGLTECWLSKSDGALYPMCPGGRFGKYDPDKYQFHNLTVAENILYLSRFLDKIWQINPSIQIIMSVSPVPLAATMENQHIIQATLYTKSVLRVAIDEICRKFERVHYFPSYDMVQHAFWPSFFEPGSRQLGDVGLKWVMEAFVQQFSELDPQLLKPVESAEFDFNYEHAPCDEEELLRLIGNDFH